MLSHIFLIFASLFNDLSPEFASYNLNPKIPEGVYCIGTEDYKPNIDVTIALNSVEWHLKGSKFLYVPPRYIDLLGLI